MTYPVHPMEKRHARQVAELHRSGIPAGFLSSLGPSFLRQLYAALPSCPAAFGYVWERQDGEVLGFVACARSIGAVYKQSLVRRGLWMALPLARFLLRPSVIRRMIQTLRYPCQTAGDLPPAEVLSIVVGGAAQGQGVGKALMAAAFEEFRRRGVPQVKVAVGADNEQANAFYRKCGFRLAVTREHHGLPMNIYVARLADGT